MTTKREVTESPVYQGANESIAYEVDFGNWGTPTSPAVALYAKTDLTTSLTAKMTGSATVTGDVVTTPAIHSLTAGAAYLMRVTATVLGNTMSCWCEIQTEVI